MEEYVAQLQDLTKEIEALEAQYSGVNTQIVSVRDAVAVAAAGRATIRPCQR